MSDFESSIYVACSCDEHLFDELIQMTLVLGHCKSFVMTQESFDELDEQLQELIEWEPLYVKW